jgi:hypothetical protein
VINKKVALQNVHDLLKILNDAGVTSWVQDGTLLGLVRDKQIIAWDHDTDVGTFYSTWNEGVIPVLEAAGFRLDATLGSRENGWQHRWVRNSVKTDIFFYYTNPDTTIWHAAYLQTVKQYRFTYSLFELAPLTTQIGPLLAPSPPETFLETKYGPNWRIPQRRWHFATSPLNSRPHQ